MSSSGGAAGFALSCPIPLATTERVLLGHGSGGKMTADLIARYFLPAFRNAYLDRLDDQAVLQMAGGRLAFTTDSHVVTPLFFPGGDIGMLAVNGTVNDLAMAGARPLYLSAAFILEEGFSLAELTRIVESMSRAARKAGVLLVTGDTKVVDRGKADGCFITTSGVGVVAHDLEITAAAARPGDVVILSGAIAEHGMTIMAARADLEVESPIETDSAPLHKLVQDMLEAGSEIHCLRDPTRGGVATALNEIARQPSVGIVLEEEAILVKEPVRGICEILGFDPLYVANEGKLLAVVAPASADKVLAAMRRRSEGRDARIIGAVVDDSDRLVVLKTRVRGHRIVDMLQGDQLPRIC